MDLSFSYYGEGRKVLDGINLHIRKGEFFSIIGVNGSGKSTLAKHFNAILLPSEGRVVVDGIDTSDRSRLWDIRRKVGMVFQNPENQIVSSIVEEEVAFGLENLGYPSCEIKKRVKESLKVVGLGGMEKRPTYALSGGEKQRLAIASVLAMEPECIVFDEPTTMLDPAGRKDIASVIRRLREDLGITIVYITHIMEEIVFSDRVAVMNEGRVVMDGSPYEVFSMVDEIEQVGLELPAVPRLAQMLGKMGYSFKRMPLTIEDLMVELCP